ncbi:MAG: citrate synthase, partial [Oscillospiraceae bacterium]|nr:citrate synthase [Oscillospiraceae bacterium]
MAKKHDLELIVHHYADLCNDLCKIDPALYERYEVKRGLRDKSGQGVLAGLTKISHIQSFDEEDGKRIPCDGKLYYRGYEINELTQGFLRENRYGFEEVAYLLLLGSLPKQAELEQFKEALAACRSLPTNFVRDVVMKAPSHDIMNSLSKSVLTL